MSALGVTFTTKSEHVVRLDYYPQLEKIQNLLNAWQGRDLSLIGKITIIKALAISKLVYLFTSLPNRDNTFFLSLKKWNNKPAKVEFSVLINELEDGGFKLFDPISFCESLKISWVERTFEKGTSCIWNSLVQKNFSLLGGNLIWQCNFNDKDNLLKKSRATFYPTFW